PVRQRYQVHALAAFFTEEFFATKKVVEVYL
ncbi:MAG: 16S rRNA (guanine(527)-N(7))-methyltransferase RsmG, partial [Bacteroidetes bacterium]|nr:16S rRNA (guanine(527)-N(7))-methyltransferase RsmG [Bacteroidota bacterium]